MARVFCGFHQIEELLANLVSFLIDLVLNKKKNSFPGLFSNKKARASSNQSEQWCFFI